MLDCRLQKGGELVRYKIRDARLELNLSQANLAERAGVSRQTICGLESGAITVTTTDTLIKIANALGKRVSDIFLD